jgi:predicted nucleotidyltransferase component of viral defense system
MTRDVRNVAASVRQRLNNLAKERGRPFQEVLQYFAIDRFLYRLSDSTHRDRFILKGAMMLSAWRAPATRSTMDIDLLGRGEDPTGSMLNIVRELCDLEPTQEDGLVFDASSVVNEPITVDSEYVGMRVTFRGTLGAARIPMQIDLGIGDAVVDPEAQIELPTLLNFPPARLRGYSRESAVAEKLHAMFQHGRLNSRLKDYFDIWLLSRNFLFDGEKLSRAIHETFLRRATEVKAETIGLTQEFASQPGKQVQWTAFLRKLGIADAPPKLEDVVAQLHVFLHPVLRALVESQAIEKQWLPDGGWHSRA